MRSSILLSRAGRRLRPCSGGLLLALVCACSGAEIRPLSTRPAGEALLGGVAARFTPALAALGQAVSEGENEVARDILRVLKVRIQAEQLGWNAQLRSSDASQQSSAHGKPGARALEVVHAYERVLDGRLRSSTLQLEMSVERVAESRLVEVSLSVSSSWPSALYLHPGPATLTMQTSIVGADGRQAYRTHSIGVTSLDEIHVQPGAKTVVSLGRYEVHIPERALALRERWSLALRAGEFKEQDRTLPLAALEASPCVWTEPAAFLPLAPVAPSELIDFIGKRRDTVPMPSSPAQLEAYDREMLQFSAPLMERVVRIAEADRLVALDELRAVILRATDAEIARLVPALRWLGQLSRPGSDPELWRRWARAGDLDKQRDTGGYEGLDIPSRAARDRRPH